MRETLAHAFAQAQKCPEKAQRDANGVCRQGRNAGRW